MARDSDLLHRLYGETPPAEPPRGAVGAWPAVWILGLLGAGAASLVGSFGLLLAASLMPPPALAQWGVVDPEEWVLAIHDHAADGSAGCALTGQRLVRFDDRALTRAVGLRGAEVAVRDHAVVVHGEGDAEVTCPFADDEDPGEFAARIRRAAGAHLPSAP
ncbi:MAG: hypothetical protein R2724_34765 [Bryobacterales bacterium]